MPMRHILIPFVMLAAPAMAQTPPPAPPTAPSMPAAVSANDALRHRGSSMLTATERQFADQEAALLRQIRLAQLQAELAELQRKAAGQPERAVDSATPPPPPQALPAPTLTTAAPDPFYLVSIWGDAGGLKADFFLNGLRHTVAQGSVLPGGWTVAKVTPAGVVITKGRTSRTLSLGTARR